MRNKKGIETGLTDFYSTIIIFLIILVFFFALKFKVGAMTYSVSGEQLSLDATQIALVYAQSPVETSLGKMTFTDFMQQAIGNTEKETELVSLTEIYFQKIQEETQVSIVVMKNAEPYVLLEPNFLEQGLVKAQESCRNLEHATIQILEICYLAGEGYNAPSSLQIPLSHPDNYVLFQIQTKIRS